MPETILNTSAEVVKQSDTTYSVTFTQDTRVVTELPIKSLTATKRELQALEARILAEPAFLAEQKKQVEDHALRAIEGSEKASAENMLQWEREVEKKRKEIEAAEAAGVVDELPPEEPVEE